MEWLNHVSICDKCASVDIAKTASLINCCLVGAPMLRFYLSELAKPDIARRNKHLKASFNQQLDGESFKAGGKKLKQAMRYK
jgi:hypothetical protein